MESLFASGTAADLVLAWLALEAAALAAWHRLAGRGPGLRAVAGSLLAGACLVLALRAALAGASWLWVGAALAAALPAHLLDLLQRPAPAAPLPLPRTAELNDNAAEQTENPRPRPSKERPAWKHGTPPPASRGP